MDRFEKLIDLGLNESQAALLTTPAVDLTLDQRKSALSVLDKKYDLVRERNKSFIPSQTTGLPHLISKDGFEAFQNPCNTDVIITSERQRQDEMKRHGCVDARELVPHGKESLIDGQL